MKKKIKCYLLTFVILGSLVHVTSAMTADDDERYMRVYTRAKEIKTKMEFCRAEIEKMKLVDENYYHLAILN